MHPCPFAIFIEQVISDRIIVAKKQAYQMPISFIIRTWTLFAFKANKIHGIFFYAVPAFWVACFFATIILSDITCSIKMANGQGCILKAIRIRKLPDIY